MAGLYCSLGFFTFYGIWKMILGIQIVGIIFCLVMMYLTFLYYKQDNYGKTSFVFWTLIWFGSLVLVSFPSIVYGVMSTLKIKRTSDFIVMLGFMFFSVIIFYMYNTVKKMKLQMEKLVREVAMKFPKNKEDNNDKI